MESSCNEPYLITGNPGKWEQQSGAAYCCTILRTLRCIIETRNNTDVSGQRKQVAAAAWTGPGSASIKILTVVLTVVCRRPAAGNVAQS